MESSRKSQIIETIQKNIKPFDKNFKSTESLDYQGLEREDEFRFFIDDNYYTIYSNDDKQPSHLYDLICIDRESNLSLFETFSSLSKIEFFKQIDYIYNDLSYLYIFATGHYTHLKKPRSLEDILHSIYYDGDNYFFRLNVGHVDSDTVMFVYFDVMLDTETNEVYFSQRYQTNKNASLTSFDTYQELKDDFTQRYILKPLNKKKEDLLLSDSKILHIINH